MRESRQGDASPTPDEVRAELERILRSEALGGSDQLKRLLQLVVERTLNGRPELLKEYNLGLDVFQRPPDYDPKIDPIVRVQARRLRSKLDEYYASEGADATFVIHIPKGAYMPVFETRKSAAPSPDINAVPDIKPKRRRLWLGAGGLAEVVGILVCALLGEGTTV